MPTTADATLDGSVIRYRTDILSGIETGIFDANALKANGYWRASAQGRSDAHFFEFAGRAMVLRHFQRGGLVGRVNRDLFLRTAPANSRAFREFDLLEVMREKGLAVPRPVAARFEPAGPFYRADIITERIPDARPLTDVLRERAVPPQVWEDVGVAIKALRDALVFHSDLNARNILLDAQWRVWIIDFDKCDMRKAGPWMQGNLDRLKRSLVKSKGLFPDLHWRGAEWDDVLRGYHARNDA